jgi:hypothetical protein
VGTSAHLKENNLSYSFNHMVPELNLSELPGEFDEDTAPQDPL